MPNIFSIIQFNRGKIMKKEIAISGLIFIALIGCVKNQNEDANSTKKLNSKVISTKDSLNSVIDSIRLANLHKGFVGKHAHNPNAKSNLSIHAHQNIPAKKRFRENLAKSIDDRRENFKRAEEARKKIIEEKRKRNK